MIYSTSVTPILLSPSFFSLPPPSLTPSTFPFSFLPYSLHPPSSFPSALPSLFFVQHKKLTISESGEEIMEFPRTPKEGQYSLNRSDNHTCTLLLLSFTSSTLLPPPSFSFSLPPSLPCSFPLSPSFQIQTQMQNHSYRI